MVAVPLAVPLSVIVAPPLPGGGLMVPEMLKVGMGWAVKLIAVRFAPLTVTDWLGGVNVYPLFVGVIV